MNIIAVDDEYLALRNIERVIKTTISDCTLSCFDKPSKAINYAHEHRVDVAFLDIEMGGMNGLLLAKHLKDIYGKTNIIFVTGYSDFALEALSMYVSGYLLKPVSKQAIEQAMGQLRHPVTPQSYNKLRVQTFGNFEVYFGDNPLHFARSKTKELFAYLVSRQGALCKNNEIISTIWDDRVDSSDLRSQFRHLVSDFLGTLTIVGINDVLIKRRGYLAVRPDKFECDFYDFCNGDTNAVNQYTGEFMAQYSWAEFTNAFLERKIW